MNEKKWFVYLTDHHEGPLSLVDVQGRMKQGQVTSTTYVWTDGMPDWKILSEVPEFVPVLIKQPEPSVQPSLGQEAALLPSESFSVSLEARPSADLAENEPAIGMDEESTPEPAPAISAAMPEASRAKEDRSDEESGPAELHQARTKVTQRKWAKWVLLLLLGTAFGVSHRFGYMDSVYQYPPVKTTAETVVEFFRPWLIAWSERIPFLGKYFSPLPQLPDVSPEEYSELKRAASTRLDINGPTAAIAVSQDDLGTPEFYVASNLPDGARFDVQVTGVSGTLLNEMAFSGQTQAMIDKNLGKTIPIRHEDGRPLARGEYRVYLFESEVQVPEVKALISSLPPSSASLPEDFPRGRKVVAQKTFFLGGVKDATYLARLTEYHERLKALADKELSEVKQFALTLESLSSDTIKKYEAFTKLNKPSPKQRKGWDEFNSKWIQIASQLGAAFETWTPETLSREFYHGALYELTRRAGEAIFRIHEMHHSHVTSPIDKTPFEIQLGEARAQADAILLELKTKIQSIESLGSRESGPPKRESM